jgi:hypothetical protein
MQDISLSEREREREREREKWIPKLTYSKLPYLSPFHYKGIKS